jgi:hypothetical protein
MKSDCSSSEQDHESLEKYRMNVESRSFFRSECDDHHQEKEAVARVELSVIVLAYRKSSFLRETLLHAYFTQPSLHVACLSDSRFCENGPPVSFPYAGSYSFYQSRNHRLIKLLELRALFNEQIALKTALCVGKIS